MISLEHNYTAKCELLLYFVQISFHYLFFLQDFNRHLDNLTEHYDIPKVSWTK